MRTRTFVVAALIAASTTVNAGITIGGSPGTAENRNNTCRMVVNAPTLSTIRIGTPDGGGGFA